MDALLFCLCLDIIGLRIRCRAHVRPAGLFSFLFCLFVFVGLVCFSTDEIFDYEKGFHICGTTAAPIPCTHEIFLNWTFPQCFIRR